MADGPHRFPIDEAADEALQRLFETAQDIQRRIYRSARRGFLVPHAVGELQYSVKGMNDAVADLERMSGVAPIAPR